MEKVIFTSDSYHFQQQNQTGSISKYSFSHGFSIACVFWKAVYFLLIVKIFTLYFSVCLLFGKYMLHSILSLPLIIIEKISKFGFAFLKKKNE